MAGTDINRSRGFGERQRFENRLNRSPIPNQVVHHFARENGEGESSGVRATRSRGSVRSAFAPVPKQRVEADGPPSQTPREMRDLVGSTWSTLGAARQPDLS